MSLGTPEHEIFPVLSAFSLEMCGLDGTYHDALYVLVCSSCVSECFLYRNLYKTDIGILQHLVIPISLDHLSVISLDTLLIGPISYGYVNNNNSILKKNLTICNACNFETRRREG